MDRGYPSFEHAFVYNGTWAPTPRLGYRWYRDGKAITGATAKSYKVTTADRGKRLQVKVTATRPGYLVRTRLTAPVTARR